MKKIICTGLYLTLLFTGISFADVVNKDPNQVFSKANALYEARDYTKAIDAYVSILDSGIESGNLYYNIGNGFFKMGRIGYAILCYDRASRLIPRDSDVRSNLEYARTLVDDVGCSTLPINPVFSVICLPYRAFNLSALTILTAIFYVIAVVLLSAGIFSISLGRRLRYLTAAFVIVFISSISAFAIRYYDEVMSKHGIVIQKSVECKYEPIDKSTTYYKLTEGCEVIILKTKGGWRQVRRSDGKMAWVKQDAVEPI